MSTRGKENTFSFLSGNNLNLFVCEKEVYTRERKERKRRTQFCSRRHRKPRPVSDARVAASYQFNRPLMNGQISFLKVPLCHLSLPPVVVSLSPLLAPSFSLYTSRDICVRFPCQLLRYPPFPLQFSSSLYHLRALLHSFFFVFYYITDSLPAFSHVALSRSSLA